jgi:large subunit ribosomal protein L23
MRSLGYFYNILLKQHSTEKTSMLLDKVNCFTFIVSNNSNKHDVKRVVEKLFSVIVISVKIINVKGKKVKFKNLDGKRKDFKKAFVYLKSGSSINFSEFN